MLAVTAIRTIEHNYTAQQLWHRAPGSQTAKHQEPQAREASIQYVPLHFFLLRTHHLSYNFRSRVVLALLRSGQ